jgi:hypothetical protein
MTLRALAGLLALGLVYAAVGLSVLWALGAIPTFTRALRLLGLGYLVGISLTGVVWMLALVLGVPFTGLTVTVVLLIELVVAVAVGWRAHRRRPIWEPVSFTAAAYVAAAGIVLTGVFFEALFRAGRLQGLQSYDGWAFWIPKAKSLYAFQGLDSDFLAVLPGTSYPPLVPILDASSFHAMGSADVVTLHLQFWLIAVALVWTVAGVLSEIVAPWILWPFIVLAVVLPRVGDRLISPQADIPLDALLVGSVAVLLLWLVEPRPWPLPVLAILLAGAVTTKREGLLFAACLLAAAFAATSDRIRQAWPRLAAVAVVTGAVVVPWRLWIASSGLTGEDPSGGVLSGQGRAGRAGPSLRLALDVFFDGGLWSLLPTLVVGSVILGLFARQWRLSAFAAVFLGLGVLGGAWIVWLYPEIPLTPEESTNPLVRYMVALVLSAAVLAPVLLTRVWRRADWTSTS